MPEDTQLSFPAAFYDSRRDALGDAASVRDYFGPFVTFAYRSNAAAYYLHLWIVLVPDWYTGIPRYASHCKGVKTDGEVSRMASFMPPSNLDSF